MSKQPNGEGMRPRRRPDGRWEARYTVQDGLKWERRSVYGRTREECAQRLRGALEDRDKGQITAPTKETVASYLTTWVAGVALSVRPRTQDSYAQTVRHHLIPRLGRLRLDRLQPGHVRQLYSDLAAAGLSPKTVYNVHGVLHRALEMGYRDGVLRRNVADLVDPPKLSRPEMRALSPDQARAAIEGARGDPLEALYVLAITAGLRQGELLGLRWAEVDLDHGSVSVVATLEQRRRHEPRLAQPKTARSRRQVELTAIAVDALRRHREAQIGAGVLPTGFVFTRADGRPLSMSIAYKGWRQLAQRAGVPPVRFHDLRHTAATLLLGDRGVHPKMVSEMLGHSSISITLDTYSHVIGTMHREAARAMDDLLGGT